MKVVITDKITLSPEHFKVIRSLGHVTVYDDNPDSEDEIIKRVKSAEIITANWITITPKIIDNAKKLKYIIVPAVGYEWVDVKYAGKKGIKVLNCPTHNADAVANLTIGLILSITRKIKEADRSLENGKWIRVPYKGIELRGRTLGIIGYGNIGKRVAKIAQLLGMKIRHADSKTNAKEIDDIISTSDIISLHMPLTEKTKNIMDKRRVNMMKNGAYFVNVSRGGLVDEDALIKALESGALAGAGLDVFQNEPFREQDSLVVKNIVTLAKMGNVVATPHIAYNTDEMFDRMGSEIIEDIKSCLNGKPINVVN